MNHEAVHRGFSYDADDQEKALQIVSVDGEEPEWFENADVFCQKCESQVGLFPALSDALSHSAIKIRYLVCATNSSISPREVIVIRGWINKVEFSEIVLILLQ